MTTASDTTEVTERDSRRPIWIRGAFMIFFMIAFSITQGLVALMAVIQFLSLMFTAKPNDFIAGFGRSLGRWLEQTARFQSAATDERPFPWAPWPNEH
ncbi:MAG TPA: DUF4389 domain-containing protein [Thermohalobaculum sp.]|nr:DUF4389 domain-containing protein [Thermohalobaculum sp.]